ncbi:methionyl-tRNA formyltransferase, partial [Thermodesulfobacteriota bacterium]
MAIVRRLDPIKLDRDSKHSEVDCTYSIVEDDKENKYLQIDTYGSKTRKIPGKKSQSIRFDSGAIRQLKTII